MTPDEERFSYDSIADTYAGGIDEAPYNAHYERPAMFSVMPSVAGQRIFDAGCGNGWYAEQLLDRGAHVDAIDASAVMVEHARTRLRAQLTPGGEGRLSLQHADLIDPLPFEPAMFDGIVCPLVMHYIEDWRATFREFRRVLKGDGWLLFSTHHPAAEMVRYAPENYFNVERTTETWEWLGRVDFYRRPLTEISSSLADTGFHIVRLLEPIPTAEFRAVKPDSYAALMRQPEFLIVLARPTTV